MINTIFIHRMKLCNGLVINEARFVVTTEKDPQDLPCPWTFSESGMEQELDALQGLNPDADHDWLISETWYSDPECKKEIKSTVTSYWDLFLEKISKRFESNSGLITVHITKIYYDDTIIPRRTFSMLATPVDFKSLYDSNRIKYTKEYFDGSELPRATYSAIVNKKPTGSGPLLREEWRSDPDKEIPDIAWTV